MIRLTGIRKSFGRDEVLRGISLEVGKGEVVAIIGPSGSGKTTLLRCVNFLERPDAGEIRIGDLRVDCTRASKKDIHALRLKTAMVFQQYNLFRHKTALENVMEGLVVVRRLPKAEARERGIRSRRKGSR
jgi:L-cystine transport system ATP-binding protein